MTIYHMLRPLLPELLLAVSGMILLIVGAFKGHTFSRLISHSVVVLLAIAIVLTIFGSQQSNDILKDHFILDPFILFIKPLILFGSMIATIMAMNYWRNEKEERFEFPILILFATLGMMIMVSSNNLIAFYLGLELQSLCLYILASFRKKALRSSEAGLKYFVLGALSSGFLLYGSSLIYGYAGSIHFDQLDVIMKQTGVTISIGGTLGLVMVLIGLSFKVSAVPFHMWTPDVYEGSPTPVTAFFAIAPKVAAIAIFLRIIQGPFAHLIHQWQQIIVVLSILSMLVGAFGAIQQKGIKRLLAYSSIGHVGYLLIGFATGTQKGIEAILVYLVIYVIMGIGTFSIVLALRRQGRLIHDLSDLKGLAKSHPGAAFLMAVFMFSMAGIPPLAGFFAKLYIFMAAIDAQLYTLSIIGVVTSVIAAFYYLRIVKMMYFDELSSSLDIMSSKSLKAIMVVAGVFILCFFIKPDFIAHYARLAAHSLVVYK